MSSRSLSPELSSVPPLRRGQPGLSLSRLLLLLLEQSLLFPSIFTPKCPFPPVSPSFLTQPLFRTDFVSLIWKPTDLHLAALLLLSCLQTSQPCCCLSLCLAAS